MVGGANPVLDYTVLHWSRCNSHWCKYCFLNMSEDYISWEAVLREDFRKTIHSIFLLLSDLEIFHPVKGVRKGPGLRMAMRMQEGCLSEKCGAFIALYPTYVEYLGYSHRCASSKIYAWPSLIHFLEIRVFGDNNSYYDYILMLFLLAGSRLH